MPVSDALRSTYLELASLDSSPPNFRQRRGRRFEDFLTRLLTANDLSPRTSYRPSGEEIDGSFVLDSRPYLLEAKWHADPLPASSAYAFRGKVDGKLLGTIGFFFSMSGFSTEAVDAITFGKHLNIVLVDRDDVEASLQDNIDLRTILRQKLRVAAEEGNIYFRRDAAKALARSDETETIHVITEGPKDAVFLARIAKRLDLDSEVTVIPAGGKLATASLVNTLTSSAPLERRYIVVVDGDGDPSGSKIAIHQRLTSPTQVRILVIEPALDSWLLTHEGARMSRMSQSEIVEAADRLELHALQAAVPSFRSFMSDLRWASDSEPTDGERRHPPAGAPKAKNETPK